MTENKAVTIQGRLTVRTVEGEPRLSVVRKSAKSGKDVEEMLSPDKLPNSLKAQWDKNPQSLDTRGVNCELQNGQISKVFGQQGANPATGGQRRNEPRREHKPAERERPSHMPEFRPPPHDPAYRFENPYNFVPAPPRNKFQGELADARPRGHHRYQPGCWSGRLEVTLTCKTPLLISEGDPSRVLKDEHGVYGIRRHGNLPEIPPVSLKGMLRSAFETVTNSRLGVFSSEHGDRLACRQAAQSGGALIPARVTDDGERIALLRGVVQPGQNARAAQMAAWIPFYKGVKGYLKTSQKSLDTEQLKHGMRVWALLEEWERWAINKSNQWEPRFKMWRAIAIYPDSETRPADHVAGNAVMPRPGPNVAKKHSSPTGKEPRWVRGWVMLNGLNMTNKHDERLFFQMDGQPEQIALTDEIRKQWGLVMASYRQANERELKKGMKRPSALKDKEYVFSRHIREADKTPRKNELKPGTLCYLRLGDNNVVKGIYPVMISRDLTRNAPAELLDLSLRPATALGQLSPADRVFGWVAQKQGKGQYKGQLRVGQVRCHTPDAIESLSPPVPLAILAAPKPQQARFYAAANPNGDPLPPKSDKTGFYGEKTGLRGRKVYPHHRQAAECKGYWQDDGGKIEPADPQRRLYREWVRAGALQDDQNRSIKDWVRPGSAFTFTIDVINLSGVELGALLWLLNLPDDHYFRLGGGKPLGFGSVRLQLKSLEIASGEQIRDNYRRFDGEVARQPQSVPGTNEFISQFQRAWLEELPQAAAPAARTDPPPGHKPFGVLAAVLKGGGPTGQALTQSDEAFSRLPIIKAFLHCARGSGLPVHYPRDTLSPTPGGKNFEWFSANEKGQPGNGYSLPGLDGDSWGLPVLLKTPGGR